MPPITPFIWPPGTPPGTPPTTPMDGGGASSSLMISTFFGIFVGVRSCPFTMSVCTTLTTRTAAGGGGGGGGGGGAASGIISWGGGRALGENKGNKTMDPMMTASKIKEKVVVLPRAVFSFPPDSIRLSSNIGFLPAQVYGDLDTRHRAFAPDFRDL